MRRFAILFAPTSEYGECGISQRIHTATPNDESGAAISRDFLKHVEVEVANARSYRGKVLSLLEQGSLTPGKRPGLRFIGSAASNAMKSSCHKKPSICSTANVVDFVKRRKRWSPPPGPQEGHSLLRPPGTGKTHTIRYLAGSLRGTYHAVDFGRTGRCPQRLHDSG